MLAFTDRPEREAQTWDTSEFLDDWQTSSLVTHPTRSSALMVRVAVTLSDPQ